MKNPAEVARGYLTLGKIKTEQTAVRLLLLGMLAGAFIARRPHSETSMSARSRARPSSPPD